MNFFFNLLCKNHDFTLLEQTFRRKQRSGLTISTKQLVLITTLIEVET